MQPVGAAADKPSVGLDSFQPKRWRKHSIGALERLRALDLPLLACGAGTDRKAPARLGDGLALKGWERTRHSVPDIQRACTKVICAGTRTGRDANGLIAFDVDGATALSWLLEHGCDPAISRTWQIHRTTDQNRFKVAFRLSPEQQQHLGEIKTKVDTKPSVKDADGQTVEKAEAVELFHGRGQVVVVGEHRQSKAIYFWPEGMGPEDLAPIPDCWWEAALLIAGRTPSVSTTTGRGSSNSGDWRGLEPCPICGRTDGWCQQHKDGRTIRCMHGQSFSPPTGLKAGDLHTDQQGTVWAFSRVQRQSDGHDASVFVAPDPDRQRNDRPAQPAKAAPLATITTTGITAVVEARGSGWQTTKDGAPFRSRLEVGDLSRRLRKMLGSRLGFDELAMLPAVDGVPLAPHEIELLHVRLSEAGWVIAEKAAVDGLMLAARENPFHPVQEYLKRVEADPAVAPFDLNKVAPQFFRAKNPLHAAMVRKWLIGAAARAMQPGCQMDYCLVLQSDQQGIGKSTDLQVLASPEWFCSTIPDQDKDLTLNIHSCWIFELAELEALTGRKAAGHLKNMLTTSTDLVRVPFGKAPERMPRGSVFAATVNKREFLRDDTGNRRFWVVPIEGSEKLDRAGLTAARDGIWKAAMQAWRAGELPMLEDTMAVESEAQNANYQEQDPWLPVVEKYLEEQRMKRDLPVTAKDLLTRLEVPTERQSPRDARRVRELAESLGWQHRQGTVKAVDDSGTEATVRRKGLWPPAAATQAATQATQATQAATQANASYANGSDAIATQATQKKGNGLVVLEKGSQANISAAGTDTSRDFWVAWVAAASNASGANGSASVAAWVASVALGLQCNPRGTVEARIRELRPGTPDLASWTDEEVAELLQSLESAEQRRRSGLAIPEAA